MNSLTVGGIGVNLVKKSDFTDTFLILNHQSLQKFLPLQRRDMVQ